MEAERHLPDLDKSLLKLNTKGNRMCLLFLNFY